MPFPQDVSAASPPALENARAQESKNLRLRETHQIQRFRYRPYSPTREQEIGFPVGIAQDKDRPPQDATRNLRCPPDFANMLRTDASATPMHAPSRATSAPNRNGALAMNGAAWCQSEL